MSAEPHNKNLGHLFAGPFKFHFHNSFLLDFINISSHRLEIKTGVTGVSQH